MWNGSLVGYVKNIWIGLDSVRYFDIRGVRFCFDLNEILFCDFFFFWFGCK